MFGVSADDVDGIDSGSVFAVTMPYHQDASRACCNFILHTASLGFRRLSLEKLVKREILFSFTSRKASRLYRLKLSKLKMGFRVCDTVCHRQRINPRLPRGNSPEVNA